MLTQRVCGRRVIGTSIDCAQATCQGPAAADAARNPAVGLGGDSSCECVVAKGQAGMLATSYVAI